MHTCAPHAPNLCRSTHEILAHMYVQRLLAEDQTKSTKQLVDIDIPIVSEKVQHANDPEINMQRKKVHPSIHHE